MRNLLLSLNDENRVLFFAMSGEGMTRLDASPEISSALETPALEKQEATDESIASPWNVVVHNDPVNLMSYVTMVFQRVFGLPRERAEQHMMEVHQRGRSILWSGMRERAELYVQQLHQHLLLATIERSV